MLGRTAFKSGLILAVVILAATNAAQAKIIQSDHTAISPADRLALEQYLATLPLNQNQSGGEDTRTITLNFGPLHFQEVFKHHPKACPT